MRLGGPVFETYTNPDEWVTALKRLNYSAGYCPEIPAGCSAVDFAEGAKNANVVIAEVGAWRNNPLHRDDAVRKEAIRQIQSRLALADEIGANCCVNVAGSRGDRWDGPDAEDLTPDTFDLIVETVREIIDGVKPQRTFFTLEPMPWLYPDSTESYVRLFEAIDRPAFAVHFDPVNLISSPQLFFNHTALIEQFVSALGEHIKCVHIKDIVLRPTLTTHLDEVRPGAGALDYPALLKLLNTLGPDLPIMLEHMTDPNDYVLAAGYVRETAANHSIALV